MRTPRDEGARRDFVRGSVRQAFGAQAVRDLDGLVLVRAHGAIAGIWLDSSEDDGGAVVIWSESNIGMRADAELARFLATEPPRLALPHFELRGWRPEVRLSYTLLTRQLAAGELVLAVESVTAAAALYGPVIAERFGGHVFGRGRTRRERSPSAVAALERKALVARGDEPSRVVGAELRARLDGGLRGAFFDTTVDEHGDLMVQLGSAVVWVRPLPWGEDRTLVRVWSVTNTDVKVDAELSEHLLTTNCELAVGGLSLDEYGPAVVLSHSLSGEHVTPGTLATAVRAIAIQAREVAPRIKERFGGRLFLEG